MIVGARVAGASLALQLGQRGHRVLMIDRDTFPSDTLSTHFVGGFGMLALQRLGALPDLEAAGFRRITRRARGSKIACLRGQRGQKARMRLRHGATRSTPYSFSTRPSAAAWSSMSAPHAERLSRKMGSVVGVVTRTADGEQQEVRARVVVGADGNFRRWPTGSTPNDTMPYQRYVPSTMATTTA